MGVEKEVRFELVSGDLETGFYKSNKRLRMLDGEHYRYFHVGRSVYTGNVAVFPAVYDEGLGVYTAVEDQPVAGNTIWDKDLDGLFEELSSSVGQVYGGVVY